MELNEAIKIISKINRWYSGSDFAALTYVRKNVNDLVGFKNYDELKEKYYKQSAEEILKDYSTYAKCVSFDFGLTDDMEGIILRVDCFRGDFEGYPKFKEYRFDIKLKEIPEFVKNTIEYVKYDYLRNLHDEWKREEKLKWMDAKFDEIMGEE